MVPLVSSGLTNVGDAYAHTGFLDAYNSVASNVISTVKSQLAAHPGYTVISTGTSFFMLHIHWVNFFHFQGTLSVVLLHRSAVCLSRPTSHPIPSNFTVSVCSRRHADLLHFTQTGSKGQPRTGNAAYATLVEDTVGVSNIFRGNTSLLDVWCHC